MTDAPLDSPITAPSTPTSPSPGNCGDCADTRRANQAAAETAPDYRLRVVPPLCGQCDDRWIETDNGAAHCPRCHPAEITPSAQEAS